MIVVYIYIYINQSVLSMLWALYLNIIHTFSGYIIIIPVTHIIYIYTLVCLLLLYIYIYIQLLFTFIYIYIYLQLLFIYICIYIYIKHVPSHIPYNGHVFNDAQNPRLPFAWKVHIEACRVSRSCQR